MNVEAGVKGFVSVPLAERFWSRVEFTDGCWLWTGTTVDKERPYGSIWAYGKYELAHRVSWRLHYGEIPEGRHVCHHCDNPRCVRPDHLFVGTNQENMLDASRKGRLPKQRKRRTHCKRGHAYDEDNTYFAKDGSQQCRTCKRRRDREYEAKR